MTGPIGYDELRAETVTQVAKLTDVFGGWALGALWLTAVLVANRTTTTTTSHTAT